MLEQWRVWGLKSFALVGRSAEASASPIRGVLASGVSFLNDPGTSLSRKKVRHGALGSLRFADGRIEFFKSSLVADVSRKAIGRTLRQLSSCSSRKPPTECLLEEQSALTNERLVYEVLRGLHEFAKRNAVSFRACMRAGSSSPEAFNAAASAFSLSALKNLAHFDPTMHREAELATRALSVAVFNSVDLFSNSGRVAVFETEDALSSLVVPSDTREKETSESFECRERTELGPLSVHWKVQALQILRSQLQCTDTAVAESVFDAAVDAATSAVHGASEIWTECVGQHVYYERPSPFNCQLSLFCRRKRPFPAPSSVSPSSASMSNSTADQTLMHFLLSEFRTQLLTRRESLRLPTVGELVCLLLQSEEQLFDLGAFSRRRAVGGEVSFGEGKTNEFRQVALRSLKVRDDGKFLAFLVDIGGKDRPRVVLKRSRIDSPLCVSSSDETQSPPILLREAELTKPSSSTVFFLSPWELRSLPLELSDVGAFEFLNTAPRCVDGEFGCIYTALEPHTLRPNRVVRLSLGVERNFQESAKSFILAGDGCVSAETEALRVCILSQETIFRRVSNMALCLKDKAGAGRCLYSAHCESA